MSGELSTMPGGEASRSAATGPFRPPQTSPMGTKLFRCRCMALYFLLPVRQKGGVGMIAVGSGDTA